LVPHVDDVQADWGAAAGAAGAASACVPPNASAAATIIPAEAWISLRMHLSRKGLLLQLLPVREQYGVKWERARADPRGWRFG
jgi:hypothetical protein